MPLQKKWGGEGVGNVESLIRMMLAFFQPDKPILRKFSFPFKLSLCILGWVGSYVQCWVDSLFEVFSLFRSSLSLAYVKAGSSSNVG